MLSCSNVVINYKQGLETPLHLAIVLSCFLFYLQNRPVLMWLSFTLAVISKLDAVPIVIVLICAYLIRNQISTTPLSVRRIGKDALLYFIFPGALWVVFTYIVFDGPVPQTAIAKILYHGHPSNHWFPFIQGLDHYTINLIVIVLWVGFLIWCLAKGQAAIVISTHIYGFALVAYLVLFYVYNPVEQMRWYYSIPEFLIMLQVVVIAMVLLEQYFRRFKSLIAVGFFCCMGLISALRMTAELKGTFRWLSQVEGERIAIGSWIRDHSSPGDTLASGHGHIARNSGLYTIDLTGLNSKIITDYKFNHEKVIADLKPRWMVLNRITNAEKQVKLGYDLTKSYYNISGLYQWRSWRIYERAQASEVRVGIVLDKEMVTLGDILDREYLMVEGEKVIFQDFQENNHYSYFVMGLVRGERDLLLKASVYDQNQLLLCEKEMVLDKREGNDPVGGYTCEWEISLHRDWEVQSIVISVVDKGTQQPRPIRIVEPMFVVEEVRKHESVKEIGG